MIPKSHPRYLSLKTRDNIVNGVKMGITSEHGLIAHGRGEAFDYLIGEKTRKFGLEAIDAAAFLLVSAKNPVISVNGNFAALCAKDIASLGKKIPAKIEVNIFHTSKKREVKIRDFLIKNGAKEVLMPSTGIVKYIDHNRRYCNPLGIGSADVVFVPLEDGDRCQALRKMGKEVITVDLNPLSRTSKSASVTIVDNVIRAMPLLIKAVERYRSFSKMELNARIRKYDNKKILSKSLNYISKRFS